ncbi:MAG TPA: hypothetical protein DDW52_18365 [Planctomycetaceae bacterium]|nr:hypothetical protein [Planctomycetaceae bacterium]
MSFARLVALTVFASLLHIGVCHSQVVRRELADASYVGIGSDLHANAVIHSDCERLALLRSGTLEIIDLSSLRSITTIWNQQDEAKSRGSLARAKVGHLVASHSGDAIALVLPNNGPLVYVFDRNSWEKELPKPVLVQSLPERLSLTQPLFKSDPARLIFAGQPEGKRVRDKGELFLLDIDTGIRTSIGVDGPITKIWNLDDEESVAVILGMLGGKGKLVHVNLKSGETKTIKTGGVPSPSEAFFGSRSMEAIIPVSTGAPNPSLFFHRGIIFQNQLGRIFVPIRKNSRNVVYHPKWCKNGKWVAYTAALDFNAMSSGQGFGREQSRYQICIHNQINPTEFQFSEPRELYPNGSNGRSFEIVDAVSDDGKYVVTTTHGTPRSSQTIIYEFPQNPSGDYSDTQQPIE